MAATTIDSLAVHGVNKTYLTLVLSTIRLVICLGLCGWESNDARTAIIHA